MYPGCPLPTAVFFFFLPKGVFCWHKLIFLLLSHDKRVVIYVGVKGLQLLNSAGRAFFFFQDVDLSGLVLGLVSSRQLVAINLILVRT